MRYQGRITTWKDDQGFGFITPNGGGKEVFIHIKAFTKSKRRPVGNELVTYEVAADAKGKLCAQQVWYVGASSDKPLRITKSVYPVYFAVAFLTLMGIAAALDTLPLFVFVIYCVASLLTFSLYWSDKRAAQNDSQRTPENTLQLLSLIGGWPGGLFAQRIFRHKSTKQSFQLTYWAVVFLNIAMLLVITSSFGRDQLSKLLGI